MVIGRSLAAFMGRQVMRTLRMIISLVRVAGCGTASLMPR
jgi:hypothetical protein